jgi:mannose-6-phosphate isomerase-like protein (cupin superfamily)
VINDGRATILLDHDRTDGRFGLVHDVIPAGRIGPPLHLHPEFDELFYVLGGELVVRLGDEVRTVQEGETAYARRGLAHTFANPGPRDTRVLLFITPAGFERHFAGAHVPGDEVVVVGHPLTPFAIAAAR